MMPNLIPIDFYKRYAKISGGANDAMLNDLISGVSARIERECNRVFTQADYYEWHDGGGDSISVKNPPISVVYRVATGRAAAMSVSFSGTAIEAKIYSSSSGVVLRKVVAAGTVTSSSLLFATYPTVSTLATAISAVSGWTATVSHDTLSAYLRPAAGLNVLNGTAQVLYADDDLNAADVNYSSGMIRFDGGGHADGVFGGGAVRSFASIASGGGSVFAHYQGGYATIPADVQTACAELVHLAFNSASTNPATTSESLGDYSYSLASRVEINDRVDSLLAPYRRPIVA